MQQVPDPAQFMQRRRLLQKGCRKTSVAVTSELAPKEVIEEEKDFEVISQADGRECDEAVHDVCARQDVKIDQVDNVGREA